MVFKSRLDRQFERFFLGEKRNKRNMEKRDEVTIKQLVDYLALIENISWAKRRLEKLEEEQTLYKDLIQENADELIRLLAESYAYYSVVYDNDLYCEAASEMLGMIKYSMPPVPPAGSHFNMTEKTRTSIRPSQKTGMLIPKRADEVAR